MTPFGRILLALCVSCLPAPRAAPPLHVHVRIEPTSFDTRGAAPSFEVILEADRGAGHPMSAGGIDPGLRVSRVGGRRLPGARQGADGIIETPVPDARVRGLAIFQAPSDGDPATPDGNAQDLLALMLEQPDAAMVEVCFAGTAEGSSFEACTRVRLTNRGLRDRPAAMPGWKGGSR